MTNLWRRLRGGETRHSAISTLEQLIEQFSYGGHVYSAPQTTMSGERISAAETFVQMAQLGYSSNPIVAAVEDFRVSVFSEARLTFRRRINGRPGDLFGTPELALFEEPWPGGTTSELLSLMLLHADFGGNAYATKLDGRIQILRPDWVDIVLGSNRQPDDPAIAVDAEKLGYFYYPGGRRDQAPAMLDVDDVAHFKWRPDPVFPWRGLSWLNPVITEVQSDGSATGHKRKFFENAATPNLALKFDSSVPPDAFAEFIDRFKAEHQGAANAYKTLFLGGGADPVTVGNSFNEMRFEQVQGAGETRIAAAAQVPPILAGLSEGLKSGTYSNYGQARRRFADATLRPLWRNVVGSLATLVTEPRGAELWYDDRDIAFLQEDQSDAAQIQGTRSQTVRTLTDAGFKPETVIDAVANDDFTLLEHSGRYSVQLVPPGQDTSGGGATE